MRLFLFPLTPLLTVDPVAQTGAQHLLAALGSDPALPVVEGGPRIDEAGSLGGGHLIQQGLSWKQVRRVRTSRERGPRE